MSCSDCLSSPWFGFFGAGADDAFMERSSGSADDSERSFFTFFSLDLLDVVNWPLGGVQLS